MNEGWSNDDYLVLFSEEESVAKTTQYKLAASLPGYRIVGLKGWDDFIVIGSTGKLFSVPTVPVISKHLEPFSLSAQPKLKADDRFYGKVKWYIKPIAFGGDMNLGENLTWVTHEQHVQLVCWWNEKHRELSQHAST